MNKFSVQIELEDGKLEEVLTRLRKAEEEISQCYSELRNMKVIKFKQEEPSPIESDSSKKVYL